MLVSSKSNTTGVPCGAGTARLQSEMGSTDGTHMYDACWKTRPPNITNMLLAKKFDDVIFREFFGRFIVGFFCWQNKICPFLRQGICIYVYHSFFYKKKPKLILLICLFVLDGE
jgi:hypothetical protein